MRRALQSSPRSVPTLRPVSNSHVLSIKETRQQPHHGYVHQPAFFSVHPLQTFSYSQQHQPRPSSKVFYSTTAAAPPPPPPSKAPKSYDFESIKALISSPSPLRILIDVREPHELAETGTIPTAINIPLQSAPEALLLSPEEFEMRFGFEKPPVDKEVVFFCKAGVRSRAAAEIARRAGYGGGGGGGIGEYNGSWLDWMEKGGEVKR